MLVEKKILESERNAVYVKSTEGSHLTGTVEQNKNVFDKYPELIKEKFNALVDALTALGIDTMVEDFANRYTIEQTDALVGAETQDLVSNVTVNTVTGVITVYKKNGTKEEIDTALEKVPATFELVTDGGETYLKVTNVDGTSTQTSVTSLMNVYVVSAQSETILVTNAVSGVTTTYTLEVKDGSIKNKHLSAEVMATLNEYVTLVGADRQAVENLKAEVLNASQTVTADVRLAQEAVSNAQTAEGNAKTSEENAAESARQAALYAQEARNYRDECKDAATGNYATESYVNNAVAGLVSNDQMVAYVNEVMTVDDTVEV